jgi:hypothetical protein
MRPSLHKSSRNRLHRRSQQSLHTSGQRGELNEINLKQNSNNFGFQVNFRALIEIKFLEPEIMSNFLEALNFTLIYSAFLGKQYTR